MNSWEEFSGLTWKLRDELAEPRVIQTDTGKRDDVDVKAKFTSQTVNNTGLPWSRGTVLQSDGNKQGNWKWGQLLKTHEEITVMERDSSSLICNNSHFVQLTTANTC